MTAQQIIRRRVTIGFDPARASGWHAHPEIEDLLNGISFAFPAGERFFIQSVLNYQERVTDPVLKEQVRAFAHQEAMHTKEHARANLALAEALPFGPRIDDYCQRRFALAARLLPKTSQLACTCALEHFTAVLADGLLRHQESFVADSDPAFAALWLWHAAEETEHKAVCFDVYREAVGKGVFAYVRRVLVMFWTTIAFLLTLHFALKQMRREATEAAAKPDPPPSSEPKSGFWGLMKEILSLRLYFDYYRPSFHPWNHDNAQLIEEWKDRYRNFGVLPETGPSKAF